MMQAQTTSTETQTGNQLKETVNQIADKKSGETQQMELTKEEKKLVRQYLRMEPYEQEDVFKGLTFVRYEELTWYRASGNTKSVCMTAAIYSYTDSGDEMSAGAFYVYSRYDGRMWRAGSIKRLHKLIKALRKYVRIKYNKIFE